MDYWNREAKCVLLALLARTGVTRKRLVTRLGEIGVVVTEAAIANRVYRGTISFAFVLQVAAALNIDSIEFRGFHKPGRRR